MLTLRMTALIVRPIYAVFLCLGAIIGVASAVIIMNLLVGYFAVARDAYLNLHPHVIIKGVASDAEAEELARNLPALDGRIKLAAPGLHLQRTVHLGSVNVTSELCDQSVSVEDNCAGKGLGSRADRLHAYDLKSVKQVDAQIRGVSIIDNDTVADYRRLLSGEQDFRRLALDKDTGGNVLPIAFLAQDSLINEVTGTYLIGTAPLVDKYERYYRLHAVLRLGAKSNGAPYLVLSLDHARQFALPGLSHANVVEVRTADPFIAEDVGNRLRGSLRNGLTVETWIDLERPAFAFLNATWVMVFSVMLSVCLVVAISIYSTLTLSVMRNRWKVALLGTIGFTPLRIAMIFLLFALGVAVVGISAGVLLGTYASNIIGGLLYAAFLGQAPEKFARTMSWQPAAWMALATLVIFLAAALSPARKATLIRPADALRERL